MYENLEPEKKLITAVESRSESQCTCTCKGGTEEENADAPTVDLAVLFDVVYYEIGGE